jgi:hypothetical protein
MRVWMTAILYYEYALTTGMEYERFWSRDFSWASFFFYINRYLALFGQVPIIALYFWPIRSSHALQVSLSSFTMCYPLVLFWGTIVDVCHFYLVGKLAYTIAQNHTVATLYTCTLSITCWLASWPLQVGDFVTPEGSLTRSGLAVLLIMRMYALYHRSCWVLGFLIGIVVGASIFSCVSLILHWLAIA